MDVGSGDRRQTPRRLRRREDVVAPRRRQVEHVAFRPWSGVQLPGGDTPGRRALAVYGLTIPQAYSTRSGLQASAGNGAPTWPFTWRQRMSRTGGPGERQKKGLLFDKVSARPATTIGFGRTRPLKLPTPTHWPPSLVVKRAELLLLPMVKEASVTLPMLKLFT